MKAPSPKTYLKCFVLCGLWWITFAFASGKPHVVVTIPPFHALVSAVMENVAEPQLLVKSGGSPHHYNLRPSEIESLQEANIIFWGGPELETFLVKPLRSLNSSTEIVELDKTPGLLLLRPRRTASFTATPKEKPTQNQKQKKGHKQKGASNLAQKNIRDQSKESGCCDSDHAGGTKDMHFWLDPYNAKLMVKWIANKLSKADPAHRAQYQENAKAYVAKLDALDRALKIKLKPIHKMPYVVFHDAYQYFEHHYGLNGVGAISIHPELPISLQRLYEIRARIKKAKAVCIFREPQFKSHMAETLSQDTGTRLGEIDPLGQSQTKDGSDYLNLLDNIANSLRTCLMEKSQK